MNELPPNLSVTPNNYPWNGAYVNSLAPNTKNGDALIRKCLADHVNYETESVFEKYTKALAVGVVNTPLIDL